MNKMKNNRFQITPLLLAVTMLIVGCEDKTSQEYVQDYVFEGYLTAGTEMPEMRLSTTAPVNQSYVFEDFAIDDAELRIFQLDVNNPQDTLDTISYIPDVNNPGIYIPAKFHRVEPGGRYAMETYIPEDDHYLRSETIVPELIEVLDTNKDTVTYQVDQFGVTYRRSDYLGRQNYLIVTVEALDTVNYGLTPFYAQQLEEDDENKNSLSVNSSGIINEGNYQVTADNTVTIELPWLAVAFYGPTRLRTYTLDDNIYNFRRTQDTQLGGGTISPGEIYNVIDPIEGGTGIFGAYSQAISQVFIKNPFE